MSKESKDESEKEAASTAADEAKARRAETKESNERREALANDELDPDSPRFVERTPRDVAINKAKAGEDTGLESSRPDRTERFRVPGRFVNRGEFEDFDGRYPPPPSPC